MVNDLITLGRFNLPNPDYTILPLRVAIYLIQFIMFMNASTYFLIFTIYCHFSKRLLKSIHASTLKTKIANNNIATRLLINVCKVYTEQKILNHVIHEMLQKFVLIYLIILILFFIVCVYVCIRFSKLIFWYLYILSVVATSNFALCLVFVHISGSFLHEQSNKLLESCQKNIIPFTNGRL